MPCSLPHGMIYQTKNNLTPLALIKDLIDSRFLTFIHIR
jgi:hypothetical protein